MAEDDPMISEIYQKKFSESGFEVFPALNGQQVLEIAEKENPDLIILDLIMPNMDGFQVLEHLKEKNVDQKIKIIISSNLSQREDREKALNLGANGFIAKSDYTPTQMVGEVNRLLKQFTENEKNQKRESAIKNGLIDPNIKKKKILLIEDEDIFVEMFGSKLMQDGFEVVSAKNGAWGIKEALKDQFDLIVLDMIMPAMTGDEIVEKLQLDEKTKNIPVIVMSASVDESVERKVRAMGVKEFFYKTQLIPSQLSGKIQEILKV